MSTFNISAPPGIWEVTLFHCNPEAFPFLVAKETFKDYNEEKGETACMILTARLSLLQILSMLAQSSEFENMQVREEELPELDRIAIEACPFDIKGGPENKHGKAAILMQV